MFYNHLKGHIEALLFACGKPIPAGRLAEILEVTQQHIELLIAQMNEEMADGSRGLVISQVAGGYQLCTRPELATVVERLGQVQETRLSMAAMETLSIIAFKQPITKQEIESIRGVKVDSVVNLLVERQLIKEMGRKEAIGRPILYGTTEEFLSCFGLSSLEELPDLAQFIPTEQS